MNKSTALRTGIAASVAAAGLTVGGIALASAEDGDTGGTTTSEERRGPGMHHRPGHGPFGGSEDLADALGVSEDEVTAAFDEMRGEHEAERRDVLAGRLDDAIADGDLTEADKESVLKAYDAGVLGGPRH